MYRVSQQITYTLFILVLERDRSMSESSNRSLGKFFKAFFGMRKFGYGFIVFLVSDLVMNVMNDF